MSLSTSASAVPGTSGIASYGMGTIPAPSSAAISAPVPSPASSAGVAGIGSSSSGILPSYAASSVAYSATSDHSFWKSPLFIGTIVIFMLAFVGINVFTYLSTGTTAIADNTLPIMERLTGDISAFVDKIINSAEDGAKGLTDIVGGTIKTGAALPNDIIKGATVQPSAKPTVSGGGVSSNTESTTETSTHTNSLQQKINSSTVSIDPAGPPPTSAAEMPDTSYTNDGIPEPDDAMNSTQSSRGSKKGGFCYIGEDRGFRSCISIDESTKCMSGDVFDTQKQCMNPGARYE